MNCKFVRNQAFAKRGMKCDDGEKEERLKAQKEAQKRMEEKKGQDEENRPNVCSDPILLHNDYAADLKYQAEKGKESWYPLAREESFKTLAQELGGKNQLYQRRKLLLRIIPSDYWMSLVKQMNGILEKNGQKTMVEGVYQEDLDCCLFDLHRIILSKTGDDCLLKRLEAENGEVLPEIKALRGSSPELQAWF